MALYPAADNTHRLDRAVDRRRARRGRARERLIGGLGFPVARRDDRPLRARAGRPARHAHAAARQVDLPPRGAARPAMTAEPVRVTQLPRRGRHALDARRGAGARRARRAARRTSSSIRGPGLRAARAADRRDRRRQRRHAACGCCPGWLAGQHEGVLDARRRRVDPAPAGRPHRRRRCAQMGAQLEAREDRFPPFTIRGARLRGIDYEMPMASRAGQVVRAARRAAGRRARRRVIEPAPSRDHTERMLRRAGARVERDGGARDRRTRRTSSSSTTIHVPGDPSSAAFHVAGGDARAAARGSCSRTSASTGRASGFLRIAQRMGAVVVGDARGAAATAIPADEPIAELDVARRRRSAPPSSRPTRSRWRSTSCRSSRCSAASPRARRSCAARSELRLKESDRIATVVDGLRGLGADIEATDDGFVGARHRRPARRHDRGARRPPAGDARRGRRARLARGRRGRGDGGRRGLLPRLRGRPRAPARLGAAMLGRGVAARPSRRERAPASSCSPAPCSQHRSRSFDFA